MNDQNLLTRQGDDQAASAGSFDSDQKNSDDGTYTGSNYQAIIGDDFSIDDVSVDSGIKVEEKDEEDRENLDAEFIGENYQKLIAQDYDKQENSKPLEEKAENTVFQVPVEDEAMDPVLEDKIKRIEDELPHIEIVPEKKEDDESAEVKEETEPDWQASEVTESEPVMEEAGEKTEQTSTSPVSFNSWISDLSEANPSSDSPYGDSGDGSILDLRKPTTPPKPNQAAKIPFSPVSVSTDMLPVEKRDFISLGSGLDRCAILRKSSIVKEKNKSVPDTTDNDNSFNNMAADYGKNTSSAKPSDDNNMASVSAVQDQNDVPDDAVLTNANDNKDITSLQSLEDLIDKEIGQEKGSLETISEEIAAVQTNAPVFAELNAALGDLTGSISESPTVDTGASLSSGLDSAVAALAGQGSSLDSAVSGLNQNVNEQEAPVQKAFDASKIDFHFASVEDKKPKNFFDNIIHPGDKPPSATPDLQSEVGKDIKPLDFGNKLMPENEQPVNSPAPKPSMFSSPKEANADFIKEIEAAEEKKMEAIRDKNRELPPIIKSSGPDAKVIQPQGPGDTTNETVIDRSAVEPSSSLPPVPAAAMPPSPVRPSIAATAGLNPNPVSSQPTTSRHFDFSADANNIILPHERVDVKKIVVKIIYGLILVVFVVVLTYLGFKFWKQTK